MRAKLTLVKDHPPGLVCFKVEIDWEALHAAIDAGWTCRAYLENPEGAAKWYEEWNAARTAKERAAVT